MNKYILWKSMNKSEKNEEEELEAPLRKKSISSFKKNKKTSMNNHSKSNVW